MVKLTAKQASDLANNFLGIAQAIGDYRFEKWDKLPKDENQELGKLQWSILTHGEEMLAASTALVMEEAGDALAQINDISERIGKNIHNLQQVQQVISVAASVIMLGASIVSKNPAGIADNLQGLAGVLKGAEGSEDML